jgi:serine/threonine protein kinase/tetratricopeptide (TPR) repeat protein
MPGKKIGQYEITDHLGRGGMADVYKAVHPGLSVNRAIKVIRPELVRSDDFRIRFQKEAHTVAELRHPNIVQVHDFGTDDDSFYMVMEFIEGHDLKQLLNTQGSIRPIDSALAIVIRIASALEYAHSRDIVHRDIKPDNIMLSESGTPILMDFGIAKLLTSDTNLTQQGLGIGTPAYMAPEQASADAEIGPAADIYALSIVLYEMLTGTVPFKGDSAMAVMMQAINDPLPAPRDFKPDISEELQAVICKGAAKNPADRYASARAFREALEAVMHEPDADATYPRQRPPTTEPKSSAASIGSPRSIWVRRAGILLLMMAVAAVLTFLYRDEVDQLERVVNDVGGTDSPANVVFVPTVEVLGPDVPRVAVYPFKEDLPPGLEYLGASIAREIRYGLARSTGLQLVYRGDAIGPEQRPRAVDVRLHGDIQLRGDRGTIAVGLARGGQQEIWAHTAEFSLETLFDTQRAVASAVAGELAALFAEEFAEAPFIDPFIEVGPPAAAYQKFLRGSLLMQKRGAQPMDESIQLFTEVVDAEPGFARAHLALAYVYVTFPTYANRREVEAFQLADLALSRALQHDPGLSGEVRGIRAYINMRLWRWAEAQRLFKQALAEAPNSAEVHSFYSQMLASIGDVDGAIGYARRAWDLNALSPVVNAQLAVSYIWKGAYAQAERQFQIGDRLGLQYLGNPGKLLLTALQNNEVVTRNAVTQSHDGFGLPSDWVAPVVKGVIDPVHRPAAVTAFDAAIAQGAVMPRLQWPIWVLLNHSDRAFATFERFAEAGEFLYLDVEFLSSTRTREFRADARYLGLANQYGLPRSQSLR